ncbi:peptide-methionine (R)-S-oxide reductase MsrB [Desulfovibrio aminophilus]|uniref:peptide-methionine (R)-S-oxide reductase MsrB n=1 Tax=Desulfovibrio aminophilus TaxID=81425 RepID=UPI003392B0DA
MTLERKATFAGGCFWCIEADFLKLPGVLSVTSGYAGGSAEEARYELVATGHTGHVEAVQLVYDPGQTSYDRLLDWFWRHIDPTDGEGQFVDRGPQYAPVIFHHDEEQRRQAEASLERLKEAGRFRVPIQVDIRPYTGFYPAEDGHQKYCRRSPAHYAHYRAGSGRDNFLKTVWGEETSLVTPAAEFETDAPSEEELRARLTPLQYHVTRKSGTEPPFANEHWNRKEPGIYVDVVSGEPLFASRDKYDSGTGWPSFSRSLEPDNIRTRRDGSLFPPRTEVLAKRSGNHLGHVFPDGPPPTGMRYCMNSAALRFVSAKNLEDEGYGAYCSLFEPD